MNHRRYTDRLRLFICPTYSPRSECHFGHYDRSVYLPSFTGFVAVQIFWWIGALTREVGCLYWK